MNVYRIFVFLNFVFNFYCYLEMDINAKSQISKYEESRLVIKEEEAKERREALNLSSDDSDIDTYVSARQRKREKVKLIIERLNDWFFKIFYLNKVLEKYVS